MSTWEKKQERGQKVLRPAGHAISNRVLREDVWKLTYEESQEGCEGASHLNIRRMQSPGKVSSKCKTPNAVIDMSEEQHGGPQG